MDKIDDKTIIDSEKEVQLDKIIHGKIDPHIYAFYTDKIPNYLKVGDTYRGVDVRISEWEKKLGPVVKVYSRNSKVNENIYFRDYAVHDYLKSNNHPSIESDPSHPNPPSKEFFKDATKDDVEKGINTIISSFNNGDSTYDFYDINNKTSTETHYERNQSWKLRKNQSDVVEQFMKAFNDAKQKNKKHIDLLMYAVMRFGKSYTALHCAKAMKAKFVIVVSAKADVQTEWKKNIQCPKELEGFVFADDNTLKNYESSDYIKEQLSKAECLVLVLTLQTLSGEKMKGRHKQIFKHPCDLLIVDETHYGAWADKYGAVIKNDEAQKREYKSSYDDDFINVNDELVKKIKSKVALHLSGTPYRLLQNKDFRKEQLISFCSMADIAKAQKQWYESFEQEEKACEEWENPYFGFPEMIRFGFNLNASSKNKLKQLEEQGISVSLSTLFRTQSMKKDDKGEYKKFFFESEVLDLLQIIDGSKKEEGLLDFLNLDVIKKGKMCQHIVIVLPYCASCDALEELLKEHKDDFINLKCDDNYKIINISGLDGRQYFKNPDAIKEVIRECEKNDQKTITLTVNRMLTGSTVEQWDTMLYLKSSSSPQEYDQATFRIQSQNIETIKQKDEIIKICKKPQTLLIDFDLNRLFLMQEQKSFFYDFREKNKKGNSEIEKRINDELEFSPILVMNGNKIERVDGLDILKAVSDYHANIGIKEEAVLLPVDFNLIKTSKTYREAMEQENEIGSSKGFKIERPDGETSIEDNGGGKGKKKKETDNSKEDTTQKNEEMSLKKKIQNHYSRILAFAFVCEQKVISLKDIIKSFNNRQSSEMLNNLGIDKKILEIMQNGMSDYILTKLDYSIQDMNNLSHNLEKTPEEIARIAVNKFNAFGSNEIPTNENLCAKMLSAISDDDLVSMIENKCNILDINSKVGEFATVINERIKALRIKTNKELNIADLVYSIPSSNFTRELVKKVYKLLGLNKDNISGFTSEDLIKKLMTIKSKEKRKSYLNKLLTKPGKFCNIHIL